MTRGPPLLFALTCGFGWLAGLWSPGIAHATCISAPFIVIGGSLAPLIKNAETVKGRLGKDCGDPARGDLLLFTHLGVKVPLLKIVIGLPGDRFGLKAGDRGTWNLLINGAVAKNAEGLSYRLNRARADMIGLYARGAGGVIPPNAWLVMGDNPAGTDDSSRFGLITRDALRGVVTIPAMRAGSKL